MAQFQSTSVTGSLTVTGQVVAQTLNVQQVTSSIVYSSGSNIFGNTLGNTQQFTGSVSVTGSLTVTTTGTELQVTSTGVNLGNISTDNHNVTGSLRVSGSMALTGSATFASNVLLSGTNSQLLQTINNSIAGDNAAVFYNSNANSYGLYIGAGSGTNHALYITDSTRTKNLFKVEGNGNVGIGTGSPSERLTIRSVATSSAPQLKLENPVDSNSSQGAANNLSAGQLLFGATGAFPLTARIESVYNSDASFGRSADLVFSGTNGSGTLTERMRITSDGYLRMAASTGGIQFNGDTAADNALDDYEEGTWTPAASYSTTNGDLAYSFQTGRYVKVGKVVTCVAYLLFSETTAVGSLVITGLPFTSRTVSPLIARFGIGVDNLTGISGMPTGEIGDSATTIGMTYTGTGTAVAITNSNTSGNAVFRMTFSYLTN
jgi:hypothetical protein